MGKSEKLLIFYLLYFQQRKFLCLYLSTKQFLIIPFFGPAPPAYNRSEKFFNKRTGVIFIRKYVNSQFVFIAFFTLQNWEADFAKKYDSTGISPIKIGSLLVYGNYW